MIIYGVILLAGAWATATYNLLERSPLIHQLSITLTVAGLAFLAFSNY